MNTQRINMIRDLCIIIVALAWCGHVSGADRPNILVIVADDLGWNDISFHGSNQIPTPNIDKLAYEGIILDNYYVSPICTPTRGALMSGKHPIHTGLQESVIFSSERYGLPLSEKIMPQWFQELGYRTHMVGKWHLGFYANQFTPTFRGFESHYGYLMGHGDYFDHVTVCSPDYWGLDWRRNLDLIWNQTDQYSTDLFTAETLSIIDNHNKSEPLFLYLPHQAVHSGNVNGDPLQAPERYVQRFLHIKNYKRRLFAGMLAALDDSVGAVVAKLKERGMYDNTVIVFTTDNGGPANGFDANAANNFPLRGVKATLWEGGVRGVGFVHSPLLKTKGYVSNQMIHVCDWLPTLYRAAGGDPHIMEKLDGYDIWNDLSLNKNVTRKEILHNIGPGGLGFAGLRVGDYKVLVGDVGMSWDGWYPPWQNPNDHVDLHINMTKILHKLPKMYQNLDSSSVFEMEMGHNTNTPQRHKRSFFHNNQPVKVNCGTKPVNASTNCDPRVSPCLFHIPTDPCEYNNIAAWNKDIVTSMLVRLLQYSIKMVPPLNTPVDPNGNPKYHNGAWVPWVKL